MRTETGRGVCPARRRWYAGSVYVNEDGLEEREVGRGTGGHGQESRSRSDMGGPGGTDSVEGGSVYLVPRRDITLETRRL